MNKILFSLSVILLCYSAPSEAAAHAVRPHGHEAVTLQRIEQLLQHFGSATPQENIFLETAVLQELRSAKEPYVSNVIIDNGRFAQTIHDIRSIISRRQDKKISETFYTALLCEIINRKPIKESGNTNTSAANPAIQSKSADQVTKSGSSEASLKSDGSSPRKKAWSQLFCTTRPYDDDYTDSYSSGSTGNSSLCEFTTMN